MKRECEQLHETIVRDIVDVVTSVKDFDEIEWVNSPSAGSIAKRASNLVLVFPVIVSSSLSISSAILISKAIERKCVSLLQILFSSIQLNNTNDLQDYIGRFHKNLNLKQKMDIGDFMDLLNDLSESGDLTITDKDAYEAVKEDMQNINFTLSTEYNPVSINDYKSIPNVFGESTIMLQENRGRTPRPQRVDIIGNTSVGNDNIINTDNRTITYHGDSGTRRNMAGLKDNVEYYNKQILPSEIKKANELMPTTMLVNFTSIKDGCPINTTGVLGVKAKLYPVDQMELVARISSKTKERNGLFNLIRATTREISFFKDLAFAIDKAKLDAKYMAKDNNNSRMFKVLERRAAKNRFMKLIKRNDASPITSLVLSQDDVEYLRKYNDVDMEKSFTARTILDSYNLMDIVVVDESLEIARFMFDDGDGVYETLTFDALEKESNGNDYKKVINLMSKISR
jgi:hypothetical protein